MTRPVHPTCPLAETTTIAWLYGEGPENHVHHVASCEDCTAVAAEHAEVMASVGPVLDELRPAPAAVPPAEAPTAPAPVAANRPWLLAALAVVAVAAAALLVLWVGSGPAQPAVEAPQIAIVDEATAPGPAPVTPIDDLIAEPSVDEVVADVAPSLPELLEPVDTASPSLDEERVAQLDPFEIVDDSFDLGLEGLLDDFDALEADLATL